MTPNAVSGMPASSWPEIEVATPATIVRTPIQKDFDFQNCFCVCFFAAIVKVYIHYLDGYEV